jgi:hypothetical protein
MGWFGMQMAITPEEVGEIAVRGTLEKKLIIIPGTLARFTAALIRILPKKWLTIIFGLADPSHKKT